MPELAAPTETVQTDSVPSQPESTPMQKNFDAWSKRIAPPTEDSATSKETQDPAVTADSAPAKETTERPGSEPENKQQTQPPRQKTKEDTERRIQELLRERDEARRERDEARASAPRETKQVSQPAPEAKPTPQAPAEPKIDDKDDKGEFKYKTMQDYNAAREKWLRDEILREVEERNAKTVEQRRAEEAQRAVNQKMAEKFKAAREKHEDFDTVAGNKDLPIQLGSPVDRFLVESDNAGEVLYHLGKNPDELERIQGKATTGKDDKGNITFKYEGGLSPVGQLRALALLEAKLTAEPVKESAPPKSSAPKPPAEVGGRGTQPADALDSAVRSGDFRAFKQAANRKALGK